MLVGLHKMAAERGDGFVPEMLDVLKHAREGFDERELDVSRMAARPASIENKVIAFPGIRRRAR